MFFYPLRHCIHHHYQHMDSQLNIINTHTKQSTNKKFITEKKWYFVCPQPSSTSPQPSLTPPHQTFKQYDNCKKYTDFVSAIDYYNAQHQQPHILISTSNTPINSTNQTYYFQAKDAFFYN